MKTLIAFQSTQITSEVQREGSVSERKSPTEFSKAAGSIFAPLNVAAVAVYRCFMRSFVFTEAYKSQKEGPD